MSLLNPLLSKLSKGPLLKSSRTITRGMSLGSGNSAPWTGADGKAPNVSGCKALPRNGTVGDPVLRIVGDGKDPWRTGPTRPKPRSSLPSKPLSMSSKPLLWNLSSLLKLISKLLLSSSQWFMMPWRPTDVIGPALSFKLKDQRIFSWCFRKSLLINRYRAGQEVKICRRQRRLLGCFLSAKPLSRFLLLIYHVFKSLFPEGTLKRKTVSSQWWYQG